MDKDDDTGQISPRNEETGYQNVETEKEPAETVKNQRSYDSIKFSKENQEVCNDLDEDSNQNETINNSGDSEDDDDEQEECNKENKSKKVDKYFTLETTFDRNDEYSDEDYAEGLNEMSVQLIQAWMNEQVIDDVYDEENNSFNNAYEDFDKWNIEPRVVKRKDYVKVETIIHIKTELKAYGLYMNQKEYCDQNDLRISGKNTGFEYTKKIGFLSGTYVKLASQEKYSDEIIEAMDLNQNLIDIKKEYTYEKGTRSKVLAIYAVEREAKEIDEVLCDLKSPRYSYMSYKHTTSDERLAAMYRNDRNNIKSRYETLFEVNLKEEVWDNKKDQYVKLEEFLVEVKHNENPLFLAIEKGAGKHEKDVNVVINPQTRVQSRLWLHEEYTKLILKETKLLHTSVVIKETVVNQQYKERLKEFLRPTLQYAIDNQNKKIGKRLKTYAQAVGVTPNQNKSKINENKEQNKTKEKNPITNKSSEQNRIKLMEESIKTLEKQIEKLKEVIEVLSSTLLKENEGLKLAVGLELDKIKKKGIENENEMEIVESESDDEDDQESEKKTITWDKTIKHNQRTVETMARGVTRRRDRKSIFGNMTGNRSKEGNRNVLTHKSKRLKQNE